MNGKGRALLPLPFLLICPVGTRLPRGEDMKKPESHICQADNCGEIGSPRDHTESGEFGVFGAYRRPRSEAAYNGIRLCDRHAEIFRQTPNPTFFIFQYCTKWLEADS